jgi:hypothetical protein
MQTIRCRDSATQARPLSTLNSVTRSAPERMQCYDHPEFAPLKSICRLDVYACPDSLPHCSHLVPVEHHHPDISSLKTYAYWKEDGRTRTSYIGKELPKG